MTETARRLRKTSDALLRDLDALVELEEQKRELPLSDPRVADLAARIAAISARVFSRSDEQRALTEMALGEPDEDRSIAETRRSPASILDEWRELERQATTSAPGSARRAEVELLAERVREEYRRAFDAATEAS